MSASNHTNWKFDCLADDSGLEVHALGNQPGVYTADWAETEKGRDFKKAMEIVWNKLILTRTKKPFTADFCCTLVLTLPNGIEKIFSAKVAGEIIWPMRGPKGHGYDPIFLPTGHTKTFGEMKNIQKNLMDLHPEDLNLKLLVHLPQIH